MKPIQWKAVGLLAAGETQEKTAAACNACALTIRRWLKRPDFQDAMQKELQKLRELSRAQFRTISKTPDMNGQERTRTEQFRTFWIMRAKASVNAHDPNISEHFSQPRYVLNPRPKILKNTDIY